MGCEIPIIPIKQTTEFGCMATCYRMIQKYYHKNAELSQDVESELCKNAFSFQTGANEHYYLTLFEKQGYSVCITAETPYMMELYRSLISESIQMEHRIMGVTDYEALLNAGHCLITLIDRWQIDMAFHTAHYVIISGHDTGSFILIDPLYGIKIRSAKDRFLHAMSDLKTRLGYSPLTFAIKMKEDKTN